MLRHLEDENEMVSYFGALFFLVDKKKEGFLSLFQESVRLHSFVLLSAAKEGHHDSI